MPIRPEMKALYPPDWPAISDWVRFDRAMGRCECDGRCGGRYCHARLGIQARCPNYHGDPNVWTGSKVVLTTMHLDHQPENCDPDNLMAGCQSCHLSYDREHHAATRAARKQGGQMTLPEDDQTPAPIDWPTVPEFENDGKAMAWLGVDATRWTAMFLKMTDLANAGPDFKHTVHGWFANAIGAGQSSMHKVNEPADRDYQTRLRVARTMHQLYTGAKYVRWDELDESTQNDWIEEAGTVLRAQIGECTCVGLPNPEMDEWCPQHGRAS